MPDYEQPANSGEAPAEFALIEEVSEQTAEPADANTPNELDTPHVEASPAEAPAATPPESDRCSSREPSPYVEAVADEPTPLSAEGPSSLDEPAPAERRHPLRFMWQMDADGRFSLGSDEFIRLIGARTAAGFGRRGAKSREASGSIRKAASSRPSPPAIPGAASP